jgi:hypothetical protein
MTRLLSPGAVRNILALESGEAFLALISFWDPENSAQVYRAVCNTENIVSRGNVFTACFFEFTLPSDTDDAPTGLSITIDNVELQLIDLLRENTKPIPALLEVIMASTPDSVEISVGNLFLREVEWDAETVTGKLVSDDPLNQKFPIDIYDPQQFPGLY